jgi:hypothetical protein
VRINLVGAFVRNRPFGTEIAFEKGLRILGHQVTCVDPDHPSMFDLNPDVTVVFKWVEGHCRLIVEDLPGKKIVYQPDDIRFPHIAAMMVEMRKVCDYALTFDTSAAEITRQRMGFLRSQKLLLTADNTLYRRLPDVKKDIDVCFVGSLTGGANHASRRRMCQIVAALGLSCEFRQELFDIEEIVRLYNRSKVVLNHATDVGQPFGHGFGLQCRHFEAGFTGACVLSNVIDNREPEDPRNFFEFTGEQNLVEQLENLSDFGLWERDWGAGYGIETGQALYDELYTGHLPQHRAKQLVEFIEGL